MSNLQETLISLRERCRRLPGNPGVYRMIDTHGTVIYVGKARHLKKRVSSYFTRTTNVSPKNRAMVNNVVDLEITVTRNENEALILESNLIKDLKPRYNIVLRDDKSYPYIYVTDDSEFPRLSFHRGARRGKGLYFGPFPNAGAVRGTINLLQKLFMLRQCDDSFFNNRRRPCLQHQIKRCTAPCVDQISAADYQDDVAHAVLFLDGRSQEVVDHLISRMETASKALDFERAARLRDQIYNLQRVQNEQNADVGKGDFDIVACRSDSGVGCVQVFFIRGGRNLGNRAFFPAHTKGVSETDILEAFLAQFYLAGHSDRDIPPNIIVSGDFDDKDFLAAALSDKRAKRVRLLTHCRGERAKWLKLALQNAEMALSQRLSADASYQKRLESLQETLDFADPIEHVECFDISHTSGEATVASCVVFGVEGPRKSDYRRFNINDIEPGDDYAAMRQVLQRRYSRLKREESRLPDLLLVDGGKGQVRQAREVLDELQIDDIMVIGIAKGSTRKPGLEKLIWSDGTTERQLPRDSAALHFIQQVRDEAHRFAITAHRQARSKARTQSPLDRIEGIGAKRKKALIQYFGGMQGVNRAGVNDLEKVAGISYQLAQKIYDVLHADA